MRRKVLPFSPWHLVLMPVSLIFVLPLVHMVLASFMTKAELNRFPPRFIPDGLHLDGYRELFSQSHILLWLGTTIVVSAVSVVAHLVLCSAAGYGFARLQFAGRGIAFAAVL